MVVNAGLVCLLDKSTLGGLELKFKELPPVFFRSMRLTAKYRILRDTQGKGEKLPLVVSLTSIASRLGVVHLSVLSILNAHVRPERIILWLNESLRDHVPRRLAGLQGQCFEIRFRKDVGPHTKLVHALAEFRDRAIVTADDDMLYDQTWLARLWADHQSYPVDVIGHQCRVISVDIAGVLLPYRQWRSASPGESSPFILPLGYGGVIYPVGSLSADATDSVLFRRLAPKADDLWFKAMSLTNGVTSRSSSCPGEKPLPVLFSQIETLKNGNVDLDGNRSQWQALVEHYGLQLPS